MCSYTPTSSLRQELGMDRMCSRSSNSDLTIHKHGEQPVAELRQFLIFLFEQILTLKDRIHGFSELFYNVRFRQNDLYRLQHRC